jgi:hypothetical protein
MYTKTMTVPGQLVNLTKGHIPPKPWDEMRPARRRRKRNRDEPRDEP